MTEAKIADVADQTFDYVIAGGGTAGLTLAARLSEDPSVSVAVIEAGRPNLNDPDILIPAQFGKTFMNPDYDWGFHTTKQPHCHDRTMHWARGKTLGGSSSLNFFVWTKPCSYDVNAWEKLGNKGWNWETFAKYSAKSETFHEPTKAQLAVFPETFDPNNRGQNGPVQTSIPHHVETIDKPFQATLNHLGLPTLLDHCGGNINGAFACTNTIDPRTHTRSYSATAYYLPNRNRKNLTVLTEATVCRVLFADSTIESSQDGLVATSLEFKWKERKDSSSRYYLVHARKEVILSAGSIKDPQILELSGLGRRDILESLGIDVKIELPGVGENLQEHQYTGITYELDDKIEHQTLDPLVDPVYAAEQLKLHASQQGLYRTGITAFAYFPLSHANPDETPSFIQRASREIDEMKSQKPLVPGRAEQLDLQLAALKDDSAPDLQITVVPGWFSPTFIAQPGKKSIRISCFMNHPLSRGTIHVTSKNPLDDPEIDPHVFEQDFDLEILVQGFKYLRTMAVTEPWKSTIGREVEPGPACTSDDDIRSYIKDTVGPVWHAVGTCSMLPREKHGVVDPELKVYGTKNLRVVDISIIPLQIAAHTQCAAYFVGEKSADIIRGCA